jgi:hypothetical protein
MPDSWWCLLGAWVDLLLLLNDPAGNECDDDDDSLGYVSPPSPGTDIRVCAAHMCTYVWWPGGELAYGSMCQLGLALRRVPYHDDWLHTNHSQCYRECCSHRNRVSLLYRPHRHSLQLPSTLRAVLCYACLEPIATLAV